MSDHNNIVETDTEKPKAEKPPLKKDVTVSNNYSNVNGTVYDQRYVNPVLGSTASVSMIGMRLTNEAGDFAQLRTGLFTSWEKHKPFEHAAHNYSYTAFLAQKNISLKNGDALQLKEQASYFSRDGAVLPDFYANTEVKLNHKDVSVGVSTIISDHLATNQAYLTAGYKKTQLQLGAFVQPPFGSAPEVKKISEGSIEFRGTLQQDFSLDADQKLKLFATYEGGERGKHRLGSSYSYEVLNSGRWNNVRFVADAELNSRAVDKIGSVSAGVEIPFALDKRSQHALHGVISASGGWVSQYQSLSHPEPVILPSYSVSVAIKLNDSKAPKR